MNKDRTPTVQVVTSDEPYKWATLAHYIAEQITEKGEQDNEKW